MARLKTPAENKKQTFLKSPKRKGHVPSFAGLSSSARRDVAAAKEARVSQVQYAKLLPGQELCLSAGDPEGGLYEVDFVSTDAAGIGALAFSVGCEGGNQSAAGDCASAPPLEGHAEPFTQSAYYSVAGGECGAGYANATNTTVGGSPRMLRWACGGGGRVRACVRASPGAAGVTVGGIVVGRDETFSLGDMISFPLYAARLHGSYGNGEYVAQWIAVALAGLGVAALLVRGPSASGSSSSSGRGTGEARA